MVKFDGFFLIHHLHIDQLSSFVFMRALRLFFPPCQIQVVTFATEHNWDSLDFFDGVDANAPRLGSYSGKSDLTVFELSAPTWISIRHCKDPAADRWNDGADDICHVLWEGCVKLTLRSQRKKRNTSSSFLTQCSGLCSRHFHYVSPISVRNFTNIALPWGSH